MSIWGNDDEVESPLASDIRTLKSRAEFKALINRSTVDHLKMWAREQSDDDIDDNMGLNLDQLGHMLREELTEERDRRRSAGNWSIY